MNLEIKVDLALVNAKAPLRALADVHITRADDEIVVRRCGVFEKYGQPPWAILPRIPIERDGKTKYVPLVNLSRRLNARVLEMLLEEYRKAADARD
jgi:hypothetical protein